MQAEIKALQDDAVDLLVDRLFNHPYDSFEPRPDDKRNGDEQTGFYESKSFISIVVGGNGCLGAEQKIYDPVAMTYHKVSEIDSPFHVHSRCPDTGEIVTKLASKPWIKGIAPLYQWTLSDGRTFVATAEHRVLGSDGVPIMLKDAFLPNSISSKYKLPSTPDVSYLGRTLIASEIANIESYNPLNMVTTLESRNDEFNRSHPARFENRDDVCVSVLHVKYLRTDVFYDLTVEGTCNYLIDGICHMNSGKTFVAAQKVVDFLSNTPPPRKDTPFWIVADTYEQACGACWFEKLFEIIPEEWLDMDRARWYQPKRNWPYSIPFKATVKNKNWMMEFKSYEQGRHLMQARSIGGAWFTEQFPMEVFEETIRGCRQYSFPGSVIADFTPIDPEMSSKIEEIYNLSKSGDPKYQHWQFFNMNTESALQQGHVQQIWYDTFFGMVSDEMKETRQKGKFAGYKGQIYRTFQPNIHLVDDMPIPVGASHYRAIDWGASEEHPFVCLLATQDALGCWYIYDEYWNNSQYALVETHCAEINSRMRWDDMDVFRETFADPSRPDLFREFAQHGIFCTAANNQVHDGIESVRRALKIHPVIGEPMLFINRKRCPYLAKQMMTYRWHQSSGTGMNPTVAKPQPLKKDDDTVDALRYMIHTRRMQASGKTSPVQVERYMPRSVRFSRIGSG